MENGIGVVNVHRNSLGAFGASLVLLLLFVGSTQRAKALPDSFTDLVSDLIPSVVHLSMIQEVAYAERFLPMPKMPEFPEGSPFRDFFVETLGDVVESAEHARQTGRSAALFLLRSEGSSHFVALHLEEE